MDLMKFIKKFLLYNTFTNPYLAYLGYKLYNLVHRVNAVVHLAAQVSEKYPQLFGGVGSMTGEHIICILPILPWQKVASDLFKWKGATYLLVVDYFSKYIEISKLDNETSHEVVIRLKSIFARHGIPLQVFSDNGPQYSSTEFSECAKSYDCPHHQ